MKELSIEEKAKAYDEIIGRAKKELAVCGSQDCDAARQIFRLFPELKESEDEKMRRWIINYLDNKALNSGIIQEKTNIKNAIAWLERQCQDGKVWFYRDDYVRDKKQAYQDGIDTVLNNPQKYGLKKQDEQKPAWSEEDESMRTRCIGILGKCYMGELPTKVEEELNWLKSLKERVQPQQEWSEEDETVLNNLIYALANDRIGNDRDEYVDWLKSLRPKPQWKPSEEQMEQLSWIAEQNKDNMIGKELMSLYQDLKKLKS